MMKPSLSVHLAAIEKMKAFIGTLQKERSSRPGQSSFDGESDSEPAWHVFEMESLLTRVNALRVPQGLPPVVMSAFRRIARMAEGHSDYTHKLALYATELAEGIRPEA